MRPVSVNFQEVLEVASLEAAHSDELAETARMWLYELRIVIPRPRRLADWAREGIAGLQRGLITSGQRPTGASSRKHRNVGPEAGCCPSTFNVHAFGAEPLPFCMATPRPMHV